MLNFTHSLIHPFAHSLRLAALHFRDWKPIRRYTPTKGMSVPTVVYQVTGGVARIQMNRPRKGNAFNPEMIIAMHGAFDEALRDPSVRVLVLTGSGKYFCTGMDLGAQNQGALNKGGSAGRTGSSGFIDLCNKIRDSPKPVIARVNGPVLGGGNGLLFCCDVRLASKNVWFQFSEVKRGLVPAMISTFIVPQLGLFHSRELFITGRRLPAERALQIGFLTELAADEEGLEQLTARYTAELLGSAPNAMRVCKELVAYVHSHTHEENVREAQERFWEAMKGPEVKYGLEAFYKRETPDWGNLQSRL